MLSAWRWFALAAAVGMVFITLLITAFAARGAFAAPPIDSIVVQ